MTANTVINNTFRNYFERSAKKCDLIKFLGVPSNQTLKKTGDVTIGVNLEIFWMASSGPRPPTKEVIFCYFLKKKLGEKSASLEPLVGFLAFVVRKLWPKRNK